jgi:tetratricopeptide (TPR) repeat protein
MFAATFLCVPFLLAVPDKMRGAPESTSWVGKTVIVIRTTLEIGNLNERDQLTPPMTPLLGLDYRVYGERENFVQLKTREAVSGWIEKKNVRLIEDAVAYFTKRLERDPSDIEALNHRGWAWALKGEHASGIKDMTEAIRLSPGTAFYNNRARIWGLKEEYDRAIADYAIAIEMGPQGYLPYSNRGTCWYLKKNYDTAIADFNRSLQLNANYAAGYHKRGLAWHAKREYDKAIADYTQALRIDPTSAPALADRANALLAKEDHAKAHRDLDDAIRMDATYEAAYCIRGRLWDKRKDYEKALSDFAEAIRLNPRYAPTFLERAGTWVRQKRYDKARADFDEAVRLDAKNADACAALALFLASCPDAKMRDGKRAIALAQPAVELDRTNANALEALAAARAEAGEFDQAIRTQQRALEGPHLQDAEAARRRLELYRKKQPYRQE